MKIKSKYPFKNLSEGIRGKKPKKGEYINKNLQNQN